MAGRIGRPVTRGLASGLAWTLAWLVGAAALLATVLPPFLDRVYYEGPASGHYDGERFFNPYGEDTAAPPSGQSRAGFLWSRLTGEGQPDWPERVAVRPSPPAERPPLADGEMRVTWVGHATALIETPGLNILTDPVWSEHAGPFGVGPGRVAKPGVRFDDLPPIDLVVVSHNHYDHMDLGTLKRLWERDQPVIVTSLGNGALMRSAGIKDGFTPTDCTRCEGVHEGDWGSTHYAIIAPDTERAKRLADRQGGVVTVTRSHHWGSRWGVDRNRALWSSFVIDTTAGAIFFAGDTGLGDGRWPAEALAAAGRPIRLALLPIGAFRFRPGQLGTGSHVGPPDALRVWNRLGRPWTLPIHWGTFRLSSEAYDTPPRMLAELMRCTGGPADAFAAREIGGPWLVPPVRSGPPLDEARIEPCARTEAVRALR